MEILIWLVAAYGMSNIIVYGSIFQGLRNYISALGESGIPLVEQVFKFISDLISCMMCTSTWVGFFMSLTIFSPCSEFLKLGTFSSMFFDGMLASGFVWGFNSIVEWFEQNRPNQN
jgi:hypothetical protein